MLRRFRPLRYRYQEFEMKNPMDLPHTYPREAPNTSVFPQFAQNLWMSFGWGSEELWVDTQGRRYETTWQALRRFLMLCVPCFFIFPYGLPRVVNQLAYGEYGERPYLCFSNRMPLDNHYIENGGSVLDKEWLRHIHSKESY